MGLRVAIQMDPIASISLKTDSTMLLAEEAQRRGHRLYYYEPKHLYLRDGKIYAHVAPLTVWPSASSHYALGDWQTLLLETMDIVLMRQDPPFDMNYLTATYYLERLSPKTLVVNHPRAVRNHPEKLIACLFPELMAPTLVTSSEQEVRAFQQEYQDIVIKPLYGHGGLNIFHVKPGDENLTAIVEMFLKLYGCPFMVQRYIPAIRTEGDKRIILVDGQPIGTLTRIPAEGEARSNLVAGGKAIATTLTQRDKEICATIAPLLQKEGLWFAGIDVIGGFLTEINVTSPTGLPTINRLNAIQSEALIWDMIEAKYGQFSIGQNQHKRG